MGEEQKEAMKGVWGEDYGPKLGWCHIFAHSPLKPQGNEWNIWLVTCPAIILEHGSREQTVVDR
jgi:hypothetical protein